MQPSKPSPPVLDRGGFRLPVGDVAVITAAGAAAITLLVRGRWVDGFWRALLTFVLVALAPPVLRGLAARFPRMRALDVAASLALAPSVIFGHYAMAPLADAVGRPLMDGPLAALDLRLFGAHPAVVVGALVHGPLLDALMLCYYSYFVVPISLAVLLYAKDRPRFEELLAALSLVFAANFVLYLVVPAVGPRYFLANAFPGPLRGGWITAYLDSLMRGPAFMADCFPSGHTAVMLTALVCARRSSPWLFWGILPLALGLIAATVVGRFHYGIDLLCAVPLAAVCVAIAWSTVPSGEKAAPSMSAWPSRAPVKA
jgi:membrane-associated phospholipid phosphatase